MEDRMEQISILALLVVTGCSAVASVPPTPEQLVGVWGGGQYYPGHAQPVVTGTDLVVTKAGDARIEGEWRGQRFAATLDNGRFSFSVPDWRLAFRVDAAGTMTGTMVRQSTAGRFDLKYTKGSGIPGVNSINPSLAYPGSTLETMGMPAGSIGFQNRLR
jgi:hypothetical protein